MRIGGIQANTLLDYPDKLAAIFFTLGCNFRCPYCYNIDLVFEKIKPMSEEKINNFLDERKNFLEAIVLSGGEATLQKDILPFLKKVKSFGYLIGLETNGSNPEVLKKLIDKDLVNFIAMDVKAPFHKYDQATGVKVNIEKIKKSIQLIKNFKHYQFRTTVVPTLLNEKDILEIAEIIKGAQSYQLQQFRNDQDMISPKMKKVEPYNPSFFERVREKIKDNFEECKIRL